MDQPSKSASAFFSSEASNLPDEIITEPVPEIKLAEEQKPLLPESDVAAIDRLGEVYQAFKDEIGKVII